MVSRDYFIKVFQQTPAGTHLLSFFQANQAGVNAKRTLSTPFIHKNAEEITGMFQISEARLGDLLIEAQLGNALSLARLGAILYENDVKDLAFQFFDAAINSEYNKARNDGCLEFAIAGWITEPKKKAEYYHHLLSHSSDPETHLFKRLNGETDTSYKMRTGHFCRDILQFANDHPTPLRLSKAEMQILDAHIKLDPSLASHAVVHSSIPPETKENKAEENKNVSPASASIGSFTHTYSVPSPFQYSPTPVSREEASAKLKAGVAILSPLLQPSEVMKDINRRLENTKIGRYTLLELRLNEMKISKADRRIALVPLEEAENISLEAIHKLMPDIDRKLTLQDARSIFSHRRNEIFAIVSFSHSDDPQDQYDSFKQFLGQHLLKDVKDYRKRQFLADSIAQSFHQSGIVQAVDSYYALKSAEEVTSDPAFKSDSMQLYVNQLSAPKSSVTLSCKKDIVTFDYSVSYSNIAIAKKTGGLIYPGGDLKKPGTKDKMPIAEVKSQIHISATKHSTSSPADFELKMTAEDLHVKKKFMLDPQGRAIPLVNSFLSKLFDDPLSGKKGFHLLSTQPTLAECESDNLYIFFDKKGNLNYGAVNTLKTDLIVGSIAASKLQLPKLSLGFVVTTEPLPENELQISRSKNRPIIIKNRDNFSIYSEKDFQWQQTDLTGLTVIQREVLDKYVSNESLSKKENVVLFDLVYQYHLKPEDFQPQAVLDSLKSLASSKATPTLREQKAWDLLCRALTTTQYTKRVGLKSYLSNLFLGRNKTASSKKSKTGDKNTPQKPGARRLSV